MAVATATVKALAGTVILSRYVATSVGEICDDGNNNNLANALEMGDKSIKIGV